MKFEENNEKFGTEQKENGIVTKIILKSIPLIFFIAAFVFAKGCSYTVVSNLKPHKYSPKDYKMAKDAGFVKGFEFVNTSALVDYCSDSGYVPYNYIGMFQKQLSKTMLNANNILENYGTKEQIKKEVIDKIYQLSIDLLEDDFDNIHSQYGISKKQYCQLFDDEADTILSEKLQLLKQQRPNMYID